LDQVPDALISIPAIAIPQLPDAPGLKVRITFVNQFDEKPALCINEE
jgi:hypothetical protein